MFIVFWWQVGLGTGFRWNVILCTICARLSSLWPWDHPGPHVHTQTSLRGVVWPCGISSQASGRVTYLVAVLLGHGGWRGLDPWERTAHVLSWPGTRPHQRQSSSQQTQGLQKLSCLLLKAPGWEQYNPRSNWFLRGCMQANNDDQIGSSRLWKKTVQFDVEVQSIVTWLSKSDESCFCGSSDQDEHFFVKTKFAVTLFFRKKTHTVELLEWFTGTLCDTGFCFKKC